MNLSVVIIAKNAEKEIKDAIESIDFADEIIVVDNGSTDQTVRSALEMKAKIYSIESISFSDLRNVGLNKAMGKWILYIDTDEIVTKELAREIQHIISSEIKYTAYKIVRKNFYFGKYEWPHKEKLERLFLKTKLKKWNGILHESPIVEGAIGELKSYLFHYSHKDLESMLRKTIGWSEIEAQLRFKSNHPKMIWWRFPRVMISAFFQSYIREGGWKIGIAGLIEGLFQMFSIFITYAKLWELQEKNEI